MSRRAKSFSAFALIVFLTTLSVVWLLQKGNPPMATTSSRREFLRIVHVDLKGAPPRISYLLSLVPLLRSAGATAILIEYEDAFPFTDRLSNLSSKTPYTVDEVRRFVAVAEEQNMEVIPLVQSFGHLEYALKLEEFRHLRESDSPQEICPSKIEAVRLVKDIIRQVMALHGNSRFIHIGCDEVRHVGTCPICSRTMPKVIFSRHVQRIANFIRGSYPGVTPLIWDDMMRKWTVHDVHDSGLSSVVEPVVWVYGNDILRLVPHYLWYAYLTSFPRIWVASAFKGASGESETIPDVGLHYDNNLSWMRFIQNRKNRVDAPVDVFGGIFITGWSRYDHFAILCELLPTGVPSLMLSLIVADGLSGRDVFRRWRDLLRCPQTVPEGNSATIRTRRYQTALGECDFPGNDLYKLSYDFVILRERVASLLRSIEVSAWASDYNLRKNFTSPWRVANILNADFKETVFKSVGLFKMAAVDVMSVYYEDFVVREWIEQNVDPMELRLNAVYADLESLMRRNVWQRRPLS